MLPPENESRFLKAIGRWGLGLSVLLVFFALSLTPIEVAHFGAVRPAFMLMAVYYWTILRPGIVPAPFVFVIGLTLDLLSGYPLGMNAFILVVVQWLTRVQRRFLLGQSFLLIWAGFAVIALGAGLVQWLMFALFNFEAFTIKPMLVSTIISISIFPMLVYPMAAAHKAMKDDPTAGD